MTMPRAALAGGAMVAILVAAVLWWDRGTAILLDIGGAIAACF